MYMNDKVQVKPPLDTGGGQPCDFNTAITIEDNFSWNGESTIQEKVTREGCTEKVERISIPNTLDYSFSANIFEVGDAISTSSRFYLMHQKDPT